MLSNKPSICQKCNTGKYIVEANAGVVVSIPYWYCKSCKEEVENTQDNDPFEGIDINLDFMVDDEEIIF